MRGDYRAPLAPWYPPLNTANTMEYSGVYIGALQQGGVGYVPPL